jgi:DNA-binding XRE family transcriptional regulator
MAKGAEPIERIINGAFVSLISIDSAFFVYKRKDLKMILREARFLSNVTQVELAFATGINQARLSQIERGFRKPSDDEKRRITKALRKKKNEIEYPEAKLDSSKLRVRS